MKNELTKTVDCLDCDKISLNVSKTYHILFPSYDIRKPLVSKNIVIRGERIQRDCKTKFLVLQSKKRLPGSRRNVYLG